MYCLIRRLGLAQRGVMNSIDMMEWPGYCTEKRKRGTASCNMLRSDKMSNSSEA